MTTYRHFVAYGVRIGLRVDSRALLDLHLPFGWRAVEDHEPEARVSIRYELHTSDAGDASCRLYAGTNLVAQARTLSDVGWALAAHAESFVAERAPEHLFVHAGVVGWEGHAIVMPGASFAGKTTLVQAWLDAGATYYSDEFAVLDRAGRVHPFARPLAIRDGSTAVTRRVPVAALGAESGSTPLPVGLVLVTLVPGRRSLATASFDGGSDAARADAPHRRRSREPGALDAHSEAGGERGCCVCRCTRRGSPAGVRSSQTRRHAFGVRATRNDLTYPRRSSTTHTEQLGNEASVYDWARVQVHALNPTAARVWQLCDGATSPDAIAATLRVEMGIPEAEAVVDLTLQQLARVHLLELPVESRGDRSAPTRRWLLRRGLAAAMLPAIYSIVAPSPVEAQSPAGAPTLTNISPNQGSPGTTVPVTLTGTNFIVGGTTVTVNSGGVSASQRHRD